jgi:hypothetical protein
MPLRALARRRSWRDAGRVDPVPASSAQVTDAASTLEPLLGCCALVPALLRRVPSSLLSVRARKVGREGFEPPTLARHATRTHHAPAPRGRSSCVHGVTLRAVACRPKLPCLTRRPEECWLRSWLRRRAFNRCGRPHSGSSNLADLVRGTPAGPIGAYPSEYSSHRSPALSTCAEPLDCVSNACRGRNSTVALERTTSWRPASSTRDSAPVLAGPPSSSPTCSMRPV